MEAKIKQIKKLMNGECQNISFHIVSPNWYRMNVDMYYEGEQPVEIVECDYDYELYAIPQYMKASEFKSKSAKQIAEEWEI